MSFWAFVQCIAPPLFSSSSSFPSPDFISCSKEFGKPWGGEFFSTSARALWCTQEISGGRVSPFFFFFKRNVRIHTTLYMFGQMSLFPCQKPKKVEIEEKKTTFLFPENRQGRNLHEFSLLFFSFSWGNLWVQFSFPLFPPQKGKRPPPHFTFPTRKDRLFWDFVIISFPSTTTSPNRDIFNKKKNQISPKCFHFQLFPHSPSPLNIREFFHPFTFFSLGKIPFLAENICLQDK